jgi:hypothetical protein
MAIRVVCPNGHTLQLKDSFAGRTGLCPVCKAKVRVPVPQRGDVSEDAILDFLGPASIEPPEAKEIRVDEGSNEGILQSLGFSGPRKRICEKCDKEIDAGEKVCPNCNTYLPNMAGQ